MNSQFNKWIECGNTFQADTNQKQRSERVYAWSNYFKAVTILLTSLEKTISSVKPMHPSIDLDFFKMLSTLYNNNYLTTQINTTPFTTKLSYCLRLWAQKEGITINIKGSENIRDVNHALTQIPKVNLFLPSHRSPIPDALVMGHIDLPHYILFGNPAMFAACPDTLKKLIASVPEFIPIGKIKDANNLSAFDKLLKSLKAGISCNVINYAQGFTPSAGEVLPISHVFVDKLIAPLLINGFIVNVYPIAYEIESEFLLDRVDHQGMTYTIKYGKPIVHDAVKELVKHQLGSVSLDKENLDGLLSGDINGDGPKYFDNYLLSFWYDNITEYAELTDDELIGRSKKRFGL